MMHDDDDDDDDDTLLSAGAFGEVERTNLAQFYWVDSSQRSVMFRFSR